MRGLAQTLRFLQAWLQNRLCFFAQRKGLDSTVAGSSLLFGHLGKLPFIFFLRCDNLPFDPTLRQDFKKDLLDLKTFFFVLKVNFYIDTLVVKLLFCDLLVNRNNDVLLDLKGVLGLLKRNFEVFVSIKVNVADSAPKH